MYGLDYVHTEMDREMIRRFTGFIKKSIWFARQDYLRQLDYQHWEVLMPQLPDEPVEEIMETVNEFNFQEEKLSKAFSEQSLMRQRILTLSIIEDKTPKQIADMLNCSVQYVNNQKYAALRRLKKLMAEESDCSE